MSLVVSTRKIGRTQCSLVSQLSWAVASVTSTDADANTDINTKAVRRSTSRAMLRKIAALQSASHHVLLQTADGVFTGMYVPSKVSKPVKGQLHSTALVFLEMLKRLVATDELKGLHGILLLQGDFSPLQCVYVVVENGNVAVDTFYDTHLTLERVRQQLQAEPSMAVFHNLEGEPLSAWNIRKIDWQELFLHLSPSSQIVRIPLSPWVYVTAGLLAFGAFLPLGYDEFVVQPSKRALLERLAQAQDRTSEYTLAFEKEARLAGWDRADLMDRLTDLRNQPVFLAGWALQSIECHLLKNEAQTQARCNYSWQRTGGTVQAFEQAIDPQQVHIDWDASGISVLKTWQTHAARHTVLNPTELLSVQDLKPYYWTYAQHMGNVKELDVGFGEPREWSGKDTAGVNASALVRVIPFNLGAPLYQSVAALNDLLDGVFIKSFQIQVDAMRVQFKGALYAR